MIKSRTELEPKVNQYPCLKICSGDSEVVLFAEPKKGIIVAIGTSHYKVGYYSSTWIEERFKVYEGKVILENA